MAVVAFVFVLRGVVAVIHDDDPPRPKILSAEDAANAGNPIVDLGEMFIEGDLAISVGEQLTVVNTGAAPHNLAIDGAAVGTVDLNSGDATVLDTSTLPAAAYTVYCSIEGHRQAGMEAEFTIR
jgi:plastocyanin